MSDRFELEMEDGPVKKRQVLSKFGPKCKMGLFAFILLTVGFVIAASYVEGRLREIDARYKRELQNLRDEFNLRLAAQTNYGETPEQPDVVLEDVPLQREKRQNPVPTSPPPCDHECAHVRSTHHGISSDRIAVLFGDPKMIIKKSNESAVSSSLRMTPDPTQDGDVVCARGRNHNRKGDIWCKRPERTHDIFQQTSRQLYYRYFDKASWMNKNSSQVFYSVTPTSDDSYSAILVRQAGMYIITSSMRFAELRTVAGDIITASYGVYARNRDTGNIRQISNCAHQHMGRGSDRPSVFTCTTWQLAPLHPNDLVYMKIDNYFWFEVTKETFYLAVIKLNDDDLIGTADDIRG